jgi:hypothetical protein
LTDLHVLSKTEYENGMCIRWYCHVERIDHVIMMNVHVFISPGYEEGVFGVLSIHLSVYMCFSSPEELGRFYSYLVFKNFSSIGCCLVNMNILGPKIEALQMGPKTQW